MTSFPQRLLGTVCLFVALLVSPSMHAAPVPYQPREREAHDLTLTVKPDGTLDLETAGLEPSLPFTPKGAVDAKNEFVLAFDYFCPEGIPDLSVAYGEPWSDERTAHGLALPKAEVMQPFRVNLNRVSGGKFGGEGGAALRLGFGGRANVRIQLRHVRVEVPDEDDLKDPAQLRAERESRLAHDRAVSDYLAERFLFDDAKARLDGDQIQFTATCDPGQEPKPGELFLAQFPIWARPWLLMLANPPVTAETGLRIEQPIKAVMTEHGPLGIDVSVPRVADGRDRLTSRWAVVEKVGEGYKLLSPAVYLDDQTVPAKFPSEPITVTTKKGMGGVNGHIDELVELGVGSVTVNLTPVQFFRLEPGSGRMPFEYQGHTYYFLEDGAEGVGKYDDILKQCADHNIKVALIVSDPEERAGRRRPTPLPPGHEQVRHVPHAEHDDRSRHRRVWCDPGVSRAALGRPARGAWLCAVLDFAQRGRLRLDLDKHG